MARQAALLPFFGRLLLFFAIFASSSLAPLLSQHLSLKRAAEMHDASEVDEPVHTVAAVKKFGKQLRPGKKMQPAAHAPFAAKKRLLSPAAGIAVLLYPCVRILLRHEMLMPIKFTSSYVDLPGSATSVFRRPEPPIHREGIELYGSYGL